MKRLLALALVLALCTTLLPVAALATELSGEEIPEKLLSIEEDGYGGYYFETFEDLKELAARTYEEYTFISYRGSETLVVEENLTLPENLSISFSGEQVVVPKEITLTILEESYPYFDSLQIEGTVDCYNLTVRDFLTVTGTLSVANLISIDYSASVSGIENIVYKSDSAELIWQCQFYDTSKLADVINSANSAVDPHWFYLISLRDADFNINESLKFPANCSLAFESYGSADQYTATIAEGCTIDFECVTSILFPVVVNGTIGNNQEITIIYSADEHADLNGSLTITESGKYTGSGKIKILANGLADPQEAVPGMDLSTFDITEVETDSYEHQWELTPKGQSHTHSYTAKTIAPTCTEKGYTTYTCTCGDTYTADEVAALGHSWDSGKVTKEPTEKETGIRTYTCTRANCGETKTETIAMLEHTHSYTAKTIAPTCTEKGYTTYTCTCGDTYTADEVAALGHKYENGTCTVCGDPDPSYNEAVTRLSGSNRYDTAFCTADALKDALGVQTFDNIVVAYGRNFADALAGSYLATELDAPILLTEDSAHRNVTNYIKENLSANGKVYILGGENSISASFSDDLSTAGISWERLSGDNRYLTNLEILAEAGLNGRTILVCDGNNFADSLSASAANLPILLVGSNLSPDQKDYLSKLTGCSFRIIGGPNSVSESIAEALKAYGTVERISGETREETSVKVAEAFFSSPETALIAYSRNFPDGLCGGPLAYQLGAPLILVNSGAESFAADYVADNEITSGIILGGTNSVPDKVANTIFAK